jgi:tetratricopeptide (TPR) repeat protein
LNSNTPEEWKKKADTHIHNKEYDKAIECYEKALEINPHDALTWDIMSFIYSQKGDHEKEIECMGKVMEIELTHIRKLPESTRKCLARNGVVVIISISSHNYEFVLYLNQDETREIYYETFSDVGGISSSGEYKLEVSLDDVLEYLNNYKYDIYSREGSGRWGFLVVMNSVRSHGIVFKRTQAVKYENPVNTLLDELVPRFPLF